MRNGRPVNSDRQDAIEFGLKTYLGAKHVNCGTSERYVSGGGCVRCARLIATEQRAARKYLQRQAAEAGPGAGRLDGSGRLDDEALDSVADDGLDADDLM